MAEDRKIQAAVSLDTSDAERGFARVEQSARKMATSAAKAAQEAGKAIDGIGDGANESAQKFSRAEASIRREIEKSTLALKTLGMTASKRIEASIDFRGLDRAKFEPYLAKLREVERAQDDVRQSMANMGDQSESTAMRFAMLARTGIAAFLGSQVVRGASNAASALYEASAAGERLRTTLDFATGNSAREMSYLIDLTSRYGLKLNDTAKAYASFAAAARGTAIEGQKTRDIFESISKAASVMGLTSEQTSGALLALQQMVSKGTVQAEELRGQLGERLPGAFQVAARAMGVTTQELGKMLERGEVVADDFLPKFAAALNQHIGDAAENAAHRLDAATNKVETAWDRLKRNVGDAGTSEFMRGQFLVLEDALMGVSESMEAARARGAGFIGQMASGAGAVLSFLNPLNAFSYSAQSVSERLKEAEAELANLKERGADRTENIYLKSAYARAYQLVEKLKEAKRLFGDVGAGGSGNGSVMSGDVALARAQRAQYERQLAARDALLNKYATPQEKLNEALESAKKSLGDLYTPEIERRITEHFIKPTKSAQKATKNARDEFAELMNRLSSKDAGLSPSFSKELETLYKGYQQGRVGVDEYRTAVEQLIQTQPFAIEAAREQAAAEKEAQKAREQLVQAQVRSAETTEKQVQKLKDEEEALIVAANLNISLAQALEAVAIKRLEEAKAKEVAKGRDADQEVIAAIEREIKARKELAELMGKREQRENMKKAAEEAAKAWDNTADAIEQTLTDALMRGFESGKGFGESLADSIVNTFKTYVAREIAKAISNAILSAIAGQNWTGLIGGVLGGNGGSGYGGLLSGANNASSLTSAYNTFANGAGSNYGAAASWATGGMSTANLAGSIYANAATAGMSTGSIAASGAGIDALLATNAAYGTAASAGAAGATSALAAIPVWGWVAIAAIALWQPLFGRKLKEIGTQINFREGDISTNDYKFEKGGWFRSDKTTMLGDTTAANKQLVQQAENIQESAKGMARALGFGTDAIDSFSGTVNVNMKGVKSNDEAAQRYNEALMDLQRQMVNAATGANMSKEAFAEWINGINQSIADAGISTQGIADILVQGMMGRLSQQEVGDQLADMIVGGIYNSIAQNYSGMIADAFMGQIITPIFTAVMAGVPISQAVSQQAIANVVATAQSAAAAMNAIFSSAEFRGAIAGIETAIRGVAGATGSIKIPKFGSAKSVATSSANQTAQERYNLETKLLQVLGKTDILRQRELASLNAANRALQLHIWAVEDAKDAVAAAMDALERAAEAERKRLQEELDVAFEAERALNDVFKALRDNIKDLRGEVDSTASMDAAAARQLIQQAIGGADIELDTLQDAIDSVRSYIERDVYGTRFERDRERLKFAAELEKLSGVTDGRLSAAEQQVELLQEQMSALDEQIDLAQQQVNALFGIDDSVKSVGDAIQMLNDAMLGYTSAVAEASKVQVSTGAAPSGGSSGGGISSGGGSAKVWTVQGYLSKNPDIAAYYNSAAGHAEAVAAGLNSLEAYATWHWNHYGKNENRKYAKGGYYPGGLALVGEEGPELINFRQPGQVYTAAQTESLLSGNGEVAKLLRKLIDEQRSQAGAIAKNQVVLNRIVSRWDRDGMPETREVAA